MGTRDDIPWAAREELLLAMASGDRIPQAAVGLATSTLACDSLEVAGNILSVIPGARMYDAASWFADVATPRGPARFAASPARVAVGEPGVSPREVRVPWAEAARSYDLSGHWKHGVRDARDAYAALDALACLRAIVDAAGLRREAHRRSQAHAHRDWRLPDLDRQSFAAVRLGMLVAAHHSHLPPAGALDALHSRAVALEGAAAAAGAARLFGYCDGHGGSWVVPGIHARAWKARDRDVLSLVSTKSRHASLVTWKPSLGHGDAEVEVATMPGDGPPEPHVALRVRDGRARCVGPAPGIHAHAAVRLLGRRVDAALAVVDSLAAVHDLHAILGV